jgi:ABC-type transport system involved in multi-copper enzyme maturation permease subunit
LNIEELVFAVALIGEFWYTEFGFSESAAQSNRNMYISLAIGANTFRESIRQPVYWAIVALTTSLMILSTLFAGFALGEESKLVRDAGLTSITIAGLLLAIFLSSSVVADEIDKRTALTVLCKPVRRFQFILGKYLGITSAVLAGCLLLTAVFLLTVWWYESPVKYGFLIKFWWSGIQADARQLKLLAGPYADSSLAGETLPFAAILAFLKSDCHHFVGAVFPHLLLGSLLSLWEVFVLAAAALAISTRASMILNVCITFSLFILGHQAGYFVHLFTDETETPSRFAVLLLRLIPNFEFLNYASDIAFGKIVPTGLVGQLALYTAGWIAIFLLLANILFAKRELA